MAQTYLYQDEFMACIHGLFPCPDPQDRHACVCDSGEIYYNIMGNKQLVVEGNVYELRPGDVLVLAKFDAYYVIEEPDQPSEYVIYTFSRYLFRHLDSAFSFMVKFEQAQGGGACLLQPDDRQARLFASCLEHFRCIHGAANQRFSLMGILILLLNEISDSILAGPITSDEEEQRILGYINEHLTEELTVKNLSQRFYMSYSRFYRLFKKLTEMTLSNYISWKRVILARNLIQQNVKIMDAMTQCGFKDYTTFYKCNYKYLNVPPSHNHSTKENDPLLRNGFYHLEPED